MTRLENTQASLKASADVHPDTNPPDAQSESPSEKRSGGRKLALWKIIAAFAALAAFLGLIAWGLGRAQRGPILVGDPAPMFSVQPFDGGALDTRTLSGKVVVVNFWASWCQPCADEAPQLEQAWKSYKDSGKVAFVGIDYVDTEPQARAYLQRFGITYLNGPDLKSQISSAYRITGVPETYIIGPDGKLKYALKGPISSIQDIQTVIDGLIQ